MYICLFRSIILYLLLILAVRLLGKRQLGEMEPSEFVVALLIADLASVPMQDLDSPLLTGIIPILTILVLEISLSTLSYHFVGVRKLLCGRPVILMEDGKILSDNLKRTRITTDELTEQLREKNILDLSLVRYVILETNGEISALVDPAEEPPTARDLSVKTQPLELPIPVICNGKILEQNLKQSGRDVVWVEKTLKKEKCPLSEVLLLTVTKSGKIYLSQKSETL